MQSNKVKLLATLMLLEIFSLRCAQTPLLKAPDYVYLGDPLTQSLVPSSNGESISCKDPKFSQMICLDQAEFFDQCVIGQGK